MPNFIPYDVNQSEMVVISRDRARDKGTEDRHLVKTIKRNLLPLKRI